MSHERDPLLETILDTPVRTFHRAIGDVPAGIDGWRQLLAQFVDVLYVVQHPTRDKRTPKKVCIVYRVPSTLHVGVTKPLAEYESKWRTGALVDYVTSALRGALHGTDLTDLLSACAAADSAQTQWWSTRHGPIDMDDDRYLCDTAAMMLAVIECGTATEGEAFATFASLYLSGSDAMATLRGAQTYLENIRFHRSAVKVAKDAVERNNRIGVDPDWAREFAIRSLLTSAKADWRKIADECAQQVGHTR